MSYPLMAGMSCCLIIACAGWLYGRRLVLWGGSALATLLLTIGVAQPADDSWQLISHMAPANSGAVITKSNDAHFRVATEINGRAVITATVDTGATIVSLPIGDAAKAGIDVATLDFTTPTRTANGTVLVALTMLDTVEVEGIMVRNVQALVHRDGLFAPLLGMSFLSRLGGFSAAGDRLTLKPPVSAE